MVAINMTDISNMSPEKLVTYCSNITATPALIILFVFTYLVLIFVGMAIVEKREKYWKILIISGIFNLICLLFLIYLPNITQIFVNWLH